MAALEPRQDLFQTSAGVGHHWRPGYYYPGINFRSEQLKPVPPTLAGHGEILPLEMYRTTTGSAHDPKLVGRDIYGNNEPLYKKAAGHYNINYNKDLHEKIQPGGWRRPLTMGNQASETHDMFKSQPGLFEPDRHDIKGFSLAGHLNEGPPQLNMPTTKNPSLSGRVFYPSNKGVLDLNDPYLTTNNKVHRRFTEKDLDGYARKDVPTYWECEEYPKAWGHGMKHNPIPKDSVPRERLPMRDTMVFKSATSIRRQPITAVHLAHSGLKSEYTDHYLRPSDARGKETSFCPIDTPYVLPAPSVKTTYGVPGMYSTEYQNVGSRYPITI